jgi:hypothetical protein
VTWDRDSFPFIEMLKSGIEVSVCWTEEEIILIHLPTNELKNGKIRIYIFAIIDFNNWVINTKSRSSFNLEKLQF